MEAVGLRYDPAPSSLSAFNKQDQIMSRLFQIQQGVLTILVWKVLHMTRHGKDCLTDLWSNMVNTAR